MKKSLLLILSLILAISLFGCKDTEKKQPNSKVNGTTSATEKE
ncbi:hypothetical protein CLPU_5c02430 [Gottschalkia purinilytica]|uniref:Lipoprotein n=1 Tax=Gottschalkia purinilytica TaxID=1503 RepID=A0A0L0WBS6_GOTPU|nr:hypothetical protein [Gottschalkia purinilytica]KNF08936.1 hypothetical protein CLPU_5c02430 [Gottschalkia purinilytica]